MIKFLKVTKNILSGFWLAAQSHVSQQKGMVVSEIDASWQALHCDPQHSRKSGHNRPQICFACQCGKACCAPSYSGCGNRMPQTCWCLWVLYIVPWNIACGFFFRITLGLDEILWTHDNNNKIILSAYSLVCQG